MVRPHARLWSYLARAHLAYPRTLRASPSFSRVAARLYFFWSSAAAPAALERSSSGLARRLVRRIAATCPDVSSRTPARSGESRVATSATVASCPFSSARERPINMTRAPTASGLCCASSGLARRLVRRIASTCPVASSRTPARAGSYRVATSATVASCPFRSARERPTSTTRAPSVSSIGRARTLCCGSLGETSRSVAAPTTTTRTTVSC